MAETPTSAMGPTEEISVQAAAQVLEITVSHVLELLRLGVISSRAQGGGAADGDGDRDDAGAGDGVRIRTVDVESYRARRARRTAAVDEIAEIVNRSPGGWES